MVKVADTQIKNIGFNTSVETGTRQHDRGAALGKIVTTALTVKKGMDKQKREQEILDDKSSTLALNDLKIGYQKAKNEYDFIDRDNPTSDEHGGFHIDVRAKQSELYNMLKPEHKQAYDLFHAQQDGKTNDILSAEDMAGAKNLVSQSLPHITSVEYGYELLDSLDGRVTKPEFFKMVGDRAESYLNTDVLKGMSSEQILELFPIMAEIKDPNIAPKFRKHILNLQREEATIAKAMNGTEFSQAAVGSGLNRAESTKLLATTTSKLIANNMVGEAIDLANNNNARIAELDTLGKSVFTTMTTNVEDAHEKYKMYLNTKNTYQYDEKTNQDMRAIEVIADVHGLDLTNPEGLESAVHTLTGIKEANVKYKTVEEDEIISAIDPIGINILRSMSDNEKKYLVPRVNELMKYTGGDIDIASEIAHDEFEAYDDVDNSGWISDAPYGMIFKNTELDTRDKMIDGVEIIKEFYSASADADTVELEYDGGNRWKIIKENGDILIKTVPQLRNSMRMREGFNNGLKSIDGIIEKTDILHGSRLKDKQILEDSKTMKFEIKKQQKVIEERFGKKLSVKQETELRRRLVPLLKTRMREQDVLAKENINRRLAGEPIRLDANGLSTRVYKKGMKEVGNLDINTPVANTAMQTIGYKVGDTQVVIPVVHPDGHTMSEDEAVELYKSTGNNFGTFSNIDDANKFSTSLYRRQEEVISVSNEATKLNKFKKKFLKDNPKATNGQIIAEYNESKEFMVEHEITESNEIEEIRKANFSLSALMETVMKSTIETEEDNGVTHFSEKTLNTPVAVSSEIKAIRNVRNNNLGNIKHNKNNDWQGQTRRKGDKTFVSFETPEHGIRALKRVIEANISATNSFAEYVNRYASEPKEKAYFKKHGKLMPHLANYAEIIAKSQGVSNITSSVKNVDMVKWIKATAIAEGGEKSLSYFTDEVINKGINL